MLLKQQQKRLSSQVVEQLSLARGTNLRVPVVRLKFNYESSPSTTHSSFQIIAVYFTSLRCHLMDLMIMFETFFVACFAARDFSACHCFKQPVPRRARDFGASHAWSGICRVRQIAGRRSDSTKKINIITATVDVPSGSSEKHGKIGKLWWINDNSGDETDRLINNR